MKQLIAIALALVLTCGLCACGRKNEMPEPSTTIPTTTAPTVVTTAPTTDPTMGAILPDPTLDTNIPDPSIETGETETTEILPGEEDPIAEETVEPRRSGKMN